MIRPTFFYGISTRRIAIAPRHNMPEERESIRLPRPLNFEKVTAVDSPLTPERTMLSKHL